MEALWYNIWILLRWKILFTERAHCHLEDLWDQRNAKFLIFMQLMKRKVKDSMMILIVMSLLIIQEITTHLKCKTLSIQLLMMISTRKYQESRIVYSKIHILVKPLSIQQSINLLKTLSSLFLIRAHITQLHKINKRKKK